MLHRIPHHERRDLIIAWLAISLAFTVIFIKGGALDPVSLLVIMIASFVTVGAGFVLHELAHKFSAMHFGYWAEFKRDDQMLVIAVVLAALVGIVFAAPGATMIYGTSLTRKENGVISAAGPVANLLLCIPFLALVFLTGGIGWFIGIMGLKVNSMIAAFNMLPVGVLDGRKILAWNPVVFVVLIAGAFGTLLWSLTL